jgi:hypothetical protein
MIGTWESHAAIERLLHEYHYFFNSGQFERLGQLFERATYRTEYPWSTSGHGVQTGAEAVTRGFRTMVRLHDGLPRVQYSLSNIMIDVDEHAGAARSRSQFMGITGDRSTWFGYVDVAPRKPGEGVISIFTAGRYDDRFARTEGAWHFTERVVYADFTGDRSSHLAIDPLDYADPT